MPYSAARFYPKWLVLNPFLIGVSYEHDGIIVLLYKQKQRSVTIMHYQNVCTVSYSFKFWDWTHWERHLDWMAMQGINDPLAFTGQEYIWTKTFCQFGFNSCNPSTFFAKPAIYAWQRMGNIQG